MAPLAPPHAARPCHLHFRKALALLPQSPPHCPPHSPSLGPLASTQDSGQSTLHTDASGMFSTHSSDHSKHTRVHTPAQNPLMSSQGIKYQFFTWTQDRPPPSLHPHRLAAPLGSCVPVFPPTMLSPCQNTLVPLVSSHSTWAFSWGAPVTL